MIWVKPDSANVLFYEWMNEPDTSVLPGDTTRLGEKSEANEYVSVW